MRAVGRVQHGTTRLKSHGPTTIPVQMFVFLVLLCSSSARPTFIDFRFWKEGAGCVLCVCPVLEPYSSSFTLCVTSVILKKKSLHDTHSSSSIQWNVLKFARVFLAAARQAAAGLVAAGGRRRQAAAGGGRRRQAAAGGSCVCVYVCVRVCSLEYMHAWCSRRIRVNGS